MHMMLTHPLAPRPVFWELGSAVLYSGPIFAIGLSEYLDSKESYWLAVIVGLVVLTILDITHMCFLSAIVYQARYFLKVASLSFLMGGVMIEKKQFIVVEESFFYWIPAWFALSCFVSIYCQWKRSDHPGMLDPYFGPRKGSIKLTQPD